MLNRNPVLVALVVLAAATWIGGFICLTVVSAVARSTLEPVQRVEFFRLLGRRYGIVGGGALLAVIGLGLAMTWPPTTWSSRGDALGALVLSAVLLTVAGVRQARFMTRLRRRALGADAPCGLAARVHRHAQLAAAVRTCVGLDTLAAIVVFASIVGRWP